MGKIGITLKQHFLYPGPLYRNLCVNFFRKNTKRISGKYLLFSSFSVVDIHKTATIDLLSTTIFGFKKYRGSRIETSLWMDKQAQLSIGGETGSTTIYHGVDIQVFESARLSIGASCNINRGAQIICQNEISIGNQCLISRDVVIRDNDGGHMVNVDGYKPSAPVKIGDHVWIGQGAIILKGSIIGDGAIIGAGAVVSGRVKANSLVMADPSRTFAKDISWSI